MSPSRRRVLVVAYAFPPVGGGGVQRTLKHVKYLPQHGYESVVVTASGRWYPARDESLVAEIPAGTCVLVAPELPLGSLRRLALNPLHRLRMPGLLSLLGWPDAQAGWIPGAALLALRAVCRFRPSVVYSTSAPVSAHAVGLIVHLMTGLPWVADFRDGWQLNPQIVHVPRPVAGLNAIFERLVVRRATRLLVADASVKLLGADADDPRLAIIRNGVDPDDLPPLTERSAGSRFRLAYVGTLYGAVDAAPVFRAVHDIVRRGAIDSAKLEIRIVGSDWRSPGTTSEQVPVAATGYVDHDTALAEMAEADVLLLYLPTGWQASSGKIYEYLGIGRPVLCVAPTDSEAAALVRASGAGPVAAPDDPQAIEDAILGLYESWRSQGLPNQLGVREWVLARYSRPELTRQLAEIFDDVLGNGPRGLTLPAVFTSLSGIG